MRSSGIGGQAVMEGIMMRNGNKYSVGVRRPDKKIQLKIEDYKSITGKSKILKLPFIRGIFNFIDSMVVGMKCLDYSSGVYISDEEEEETEPGKFEKAMTKIFGDKAEKVLTTFIMILSIVLAIGIFALLPAFFGSLLHKVIENHYIVSLLEGLIRLTIFILYVWLISFLQDIKRTYMYHGAEHKCINCVEHGLPLTIENVKGSSRFHKRCGTSFLLIVMIISILLFMVIDARTIWIKFLSRIALIPVVAGISYEFLRLAGNSDNCIINLLSKPGLCLQRITTSEPDETMIEVAIAAVEAVFDWREYESVNNGLNKEELTGIEAVTSEIVIDDGHLDDENAEEEKEDQGGDSTAKEADETVKET